MSEIVVAGRCGTARSPFGLPIRLSGPGQNFIVAPDGISAACPLLDAASHDYLEIACAVFAADGAVRRGGDTRSSFGAAWRRDFEFAIPVRRPEVWGSEPMRAALANAAEFLTDDRFAFAFSGDTAPIRRTPSLFTEDPTHVADSVILFSGGLDSFAGALERLATTNEHVVLVTHRSAQKAIPRQKALGRYLAHRFPRRVHHFQIRAKRLVGSSSESTQRARSFLFAALGHLVARAFMARRVLFFENGVISHNLPISPQVIGTMATRTTHPEALRRLGVIFQRLSEATGQGMVDLQNPYAWLTKTEVLKRIADHGAVDQIRGAVSCTKLRQQSTSVTHCGACSQCLDRRFAMVAAGLAEHDDPSLYETDVFLGKRDSDRSRTLALDWTRSSWQAAELDFAGFLAEFAGELTRITAGHPDRDQADALAKAHDLHRRHGHAARKALIEMHRAQAEALLDGSLPETSLLRMFAAGATGPPVELPAPASRVTTRGVAADPSPPPPLSRPGPPRLEVVFTADKKGRLVDVIDLDSIAGKQAEMLYALKVPFEEDLATQRARCDYRYSKPREIMPEATKGQVKMLVHRCRETLATAYVHREGRTPGRDLLVESRKPSGYRLDPDIRIVKRPPPD